MKNFFVLFTFAILNTLMIAACTPSGGGAGGNGDSVRPLYLGDLDKKVNEIYSKENEARMDACDFQWRPKILEISRALEERRDKIAELARKQSASEGVALVNLGDFTFVNDIANPAGKDEWKNLLISWSRVANIYQLIKDKPEDPRWIRMNQLARSIVVDDNYRIINGAFYGLSHDSGPKIFAIQAKLVGCQKDAQCTNPDLSTEESNYLSSNPIYNYYINSLRGKKMSFEDKREVLNRFVIRINMNAARFGFSKESRLRVEGDTLVVPLDLSVFGEDGAKHFIEVIETAWNQDPQYKMRVELSNDPKLSYKVQMDPAVGNRAFVNRKDFFMQLFERNSLKTIVHEFGHILGFNDYYFTTWNTTTCAYNYESNEGDVMSSSHDGAILPRHWEDLKKVYWGQ